MGSGKLFEDLLKIMAQLRGPEGCPWDKAQTHASIAPCLIEESYEVLEAIDKQKPPALQEELGDLLLQVVFHAQLAHEAKQFEMGDILQQLTAKLIRRHPHVFGNEKQASAEAAIQNWEKIKATEKPRGSSILAGVPKSLPALARAQRLGAKAARVGFDWPDSAGVLNKVAEEIQELSAARKQQSPEKIEEEFGDILFSLAQLSRFIQVNAEEALRKSAAKFQNRFRWMEAKLETEKKSWDELANEEKEQLWIQAKLCTNFVKNL